MIENFDHPSEKIFDNSLKWYEIRGLAVGTKVGPPVKWVYDRSGRTKIIPTGKGPPDYIIAIAQANPCNHGALFCSIEVKHITGKSYSTIRDIQYQTGKIKRKLLNQIEYLKSYRKVGAIAGLMVQWSYKDIPPEWWWYSIDSIEYLFNEGDKKINGIKISRTKVKGYVCGVKIPSVEISHGADKSSFTINDLNLIGCIVPDWLGEVMNDV